MQNLITHLLSLLPSKDIVQELKRLLSLRLLISVKQTLLAIMRSTKQSFRVGKTTAEVYCWKDTNLNLLLTTKTIKATVLFTMLSAFQPVQPPKDQTGLLSKNLWNTVLILTHLRVRIWQGNCLGKWSKIASIKSLVTRNSFRKCLNWLRTRLKTKSKGKKSRHIGTLSMFLSVKMAACLDSQISWIRKCKRNTAQTQ